MTMQLLIGDKNYSSWSMRPWVLMKQLGLPFSEQLIPMTFGADTRFKAAVLAVSPAGKVPVLVDDGFVVWDTLAIAEHLHERFPAAGVWPAEARARSRARSLAAEMHSGFAALRTHCPMNLQAALPEAGQRVFDEREDVRSDLARIEAMWGAALADSGGPMLFGSFSAADAFFAPVCTRIRTYALPVGEGAAGYVQRVLALPAVAEWTREALLEDHFLAEAEPYRAPPQR